jgi:hypothetical protein
MTRLFAFVIFVFFTTSAFAAEWEGVYEGTLGKSRIIVELRQSLPEKREFSRYSYLPKPRDINLVLTSQKMPLRFEETLLQPYEIETAKAGKQKITGKWTLSISGAQASGTWESPDGKKSLPIALNRSVSGDDGYPGLWLKEVKFADTGVVKTFGLVETRYVQDTVFGISYPMIGKLPDQARMAAANEMLMKDHRASLLQYRDCINGVPAELAMDADEGPEFSYDITFASPTLLSIREAGSVFCGGAHPQNYVRPITYDLTTTTRMGGDYDLDLSPAGFGRVLRLANKEDRIAFERFAMDRWRKGAADDTQMKGECDETWTDGAPEGESNFSLSFENAGLAVLRTDYAHAMSACLFADFNPVVISWKELLPWLVTGQKLIDAKPN